MTFDPRLKDRPATTMNPTVFALLDDRAATPQSPSSRLYTGFVREHRCVDPANLDATWAQVASDQRQGLHALVMLDYEWGAKLLQAGQAKLTAHDASAMRVLMFTDLAHLSLQDVDAWLSQLEDADGPTQPCGVMNLQASVDQASFTQAIDRIHALIQAGETYQVNYTYRLHGQAYGSPVGLYRKLRVRQPVAFGALIALPVASADEATHVLSCSPELFLRHEGGVLTARPMKGTASRIAQVEADSEAARHLSLDTKNRAENLMIVDLLRNDLSKLAQTGSVKVPHLFTIEPYATVFQMTSTVQARLKPEVGFTDVLRAAFPCGSITGAPKHHTMDLIAQLETEPRGLYCGALGWIDAPQGDALCGDFCFSVTIRTATLKAERDGLRPACIGVGAGIVLDSKADDEFEECRLKARFLTRLDPGFALFETMLVTPAGEVARLASHMRRLASSAATLAFAFDEAAALQAIQDALAAHMAAPLAHGQAPSPHRLRLTLSHDGTLGVALAPLPPLQQADPQHVELILSPHRLPVAKPLAAHKTTWRQHYDEGVAMAHSVGAFDSLFVNTDGLLVEGGRTNVFVQIDGRWWTPPVSDGALPGVMRAAVLADPAWQATERSLHLDDLMRADAIMVSNALRGTLKAKLMHVAELPVT